MQSWIIITNVSEMEFNVLVAKAVAKKCDGLRKFIKLTRNNYLRKAHLAQPNSVKYRFFIKSKGRILKDQWTLDNIEAKKQNVVMTIMMNFNCLTSQSLHFYCKMGEILKLLIMPLLKHKQPGRKCSSYVKWRNK